MPMTQQNFMFEYYIRPNMVHRADAACLRSKVDNMIGEHIPRLQQAIGVS